MIAVGARWRGRWWGRHRQFFGATGAGDGGHALTTTTRNQSMVASGRALHTVSRVFHCLILCPTTST
eukprot:1291036-Lingulodinium_polyedra.AAC.1